MEKQFGVMGLLITGAMWMYGGWQTGLVMLTIFSLLFLFAVKVESANPRRQKDVYDLLGEVREGKYG